MKLGRWAFRTRQVLMTAAPFVALAWATQPAAAAPLLFSYSEPGLSTSFVLDTNPTPINPTNNSFSAAVTAMSVSIAMNDPLYLGSSSVAFLAVGSGGFEASIANTTYNMLGAQLFTGGTGGSGRFGTQEPPVFAPGSFALTDQQTSQDGTLTITPLSAAPEPSTWALMLVGLGLAGGALRTGRRHRPARD